LTVPVPVLALVQVLVLVLVLVLNAAAAFPLLCVCLPHPAFPPCFPFRVIRRGLCVARAGIIPPLDS
jgi:hypothetical protein